jgi:hypothetical protein
MRSFEADEKIITRNPSSAWFVYFAFIDIQACRLQNFFSGQAEAPFLHQHCSFVLFMEVESIWSTQRMAFYPSKFLIMFK